MGEAFITRRGGGTPYAAIGVTYPSGSVCTCTNGTLTLTAKDTTGRALFVIPYAGTWTITATDGDKTKAVEIEITEQGQCESVAINYALYLYDSGDEFASTTGGWVRRRGVLEKKATELFIHGSGECGIAQTTNKINLAEYKSLNAIVSSTGSNDFSVGLTTSTTHGVGSPTGIVAESAWKGNATDKTISIDITNINDENNYVYAYSHAYETTVGITVKKVWLE